MQSLFMPLETWFCDLYVYRDGWTQGDGIAIEQFRT